MKTFFIVLLGWLINFAQIRSANFNPSFSTHEESNEIITYHYLTSQVPNTNDRFTSKNSFGDNHSSHQRMDSIIANSVSGNSSKLLFEYDENDNFKDQIVLTKTSGTEWEFYSKYEYFYDGTQNLVLRLDFGWNQNEWDTLARLNYEYNEQGLISQSIYQLFTSNSWENSKRTTYQYDSFENQIQKLIERWDNGWENQYLDVNYFSNINRHDSLITQTWNLTEWENNSKTVFFYNQQTGFVDYLFTKVWDSGIWENSMQRNITNDENGNQILQLDELWNGSGWENSIRRFYAFDNLNYTLTANCELWNGTQWYLDDGDFWIMNPDGFIRFFYMNNVSIYYKTTGIKDDINSEPVSFILYQNYPNPFNSTTTIKYIIPKSGKVTLKVFDLLGNEVATLVDIYQTTGSYEVIYQTNDHSSGIYFYQIQADNFKATKKLILLK